MEREEALQWLTNEKWKNANNKYKKEWNEAFDMAIEALSVTNLKEEFESADTVSREAHYDAVANRITDMEERGFVSVVRCKDCRHAEHRKQMPNQVYCFRDKLCLHGYLRDDDDFCKYGEKEDE